MPQSGKPSSTAKKWMLAKLQSDDGIVGFVIDSVSRQCLRPTATYMVPAQRRLRGYDTECLRSRNFTPTLRDGITARFGRED